MHSGHNFFVSYNNQETEAHLWLDPFQKITNNTDLLWNLEIYPHGKNLQVLKIKMQSDGSYLELFRDPDLNTDTKTVMEIIQNILTRYKDSNNYKTLFLK